MDRRVKPAANPIASPDAIHHRIIMLITSGTGSVTTDPRVKTSIASSQKSWLTNEFGVVSRVMAFQEPANRAVELTIAPATPHEVLNPSARIRAA